MLSVGGRAVGEDGVRGRARWWRDARTDAHLDLQPHTASHWTLTSVSWEREVGGGPEASVRGGCTWEGPGVPEACLPDGPETAGGLQAGWSSALAPPGCNSQTFSIRKWRESRSVRSASLRPHGLVRGILQARILKWVSIPFSRGSCQPRNRTQVSCIAGIFFTSWATREALSTWGVKLSLALAVGKILTD